MTPETDEDRSSPPTIYDVAKAAGVAPSTVSRALSRPGRVSAATVEKVRAKAEEIGYWRVRHTPVLQEHTSRLVAMLVADSGNPVFTAVTRGAAEAAEEAGYTLITVDTAESDQRERTSAERLAPAVEGLILTSPRLSNSGIRSIAKHRPVVILNREVAGIPSVLTDGRTGAIEAAKYLAGLGHRSILYVSGPETSWANGVRWRGLEEAGATLGIRVRRTGPHEPTVLGGTRADRDWLENPTSAVVAFNDMVAIGLIRSLSAHGIDVPSEVSVVGFDNSVPGALTTPALTSIASPLREQGALGFNMLRQLLAKEPVRDKPVLLPLNTVVRDSTGPVNPNFSAWARSLRG